MYMAVFRVVPMYFLGSCVHNWATVCTPLLPRPGCHHRTAPKSIHYDGQNDATRYMLASDLALPDFPKAARMSSWYMFLWLLTLSPLIFFEYQVRIADTCFSQSPTCLHAMSVHPPVQFGSRQIYNNCDPLCCLLVEGQRRIYPWL